MQQKKKKKKGNFGGFLGDDDIIEGKNVMPWPSQKRPKHFIYFFLQESIGEVYFCSFDNYFQFVEYLLDLLYRYIQLVSGM